MPWKTDDNGTMVLTDGNPVWIEEDGNEKVVNYSAMADSLRKANREAAERKAALRELEPLKAAVEGIEDLPGFVKTAKKNAELVAAMDAKVKQGEEDMQARIAAALKPVQDKLAESENARAELTSCYNAEKIGNAFAGSKYASEKLQSAALARELFARNFSVEDGELVARSATGEPLYNGEGKPATHRSSVWFMPAAYCCGCSWLSRLYSAGTLPHAFHWPIAMRQWSLWHCASCRSALLCPRYGGKPERCSLPPLCCWWPIWARQIPASPHWCPFSIRPGSVPT